MPAAVIFDVDGTLLDSVDQHARSWVDAFKEYGRDIPFADMRRQIGKGGDQLLPVFLSEQEIEELGHEMEKRRGVILKERYLPEVKAFPAVRELFERVRAAGLCIALASSAKEDELQTYKEIAGIIGLLDVETSSDDAEGSKPEPDIFLAALQKLGNPDPASTIVVGDTPYDAEAAGKAGLRSIGLLCGGFPEDELRRAGCVAVYRDPADLLARFDASPLGGKP
jgi:HAD superfamily hydrolase (TIGR01509 family)